MILASRLRPSPEFDHESSRWARAHTKVMKGKKITCLDTMRHRKIAQDFKWSEALSSGLSVKQRQTPGNMVRVPETWAVPLIRPSGEKISDAVESLVEALSRVNAPDPRPKSIHARLSRICESDPVFQAVEHFDANLSPSTSTFLGKFDVPEGCCAACDDKSPKSGWVMPVSEYIDLVVGYLHGSSTWRLTEWSKEDASKELKERLISSLPPKVRKLVKWREDGFLPYLYVHPKSKCFQTVEDEDGNMRSVHVCPKEVHSCVRRIVSFAQLPGRNIWKTLSRAVDVMVKKEGLSAELWRLKDLRPQYNRALRHLYNNPRWESVCECCGGEKDRVGMASCDAGAFFEQVTAEVGKTSVTSLAERLSAEFGMTHVTVKNSKNSEGWLAVNGYLSGGDTTLSFDDIVSSMHALLDVDLVSAGDLVFKSDTLLIGSFVSKAITSVIAGANERVWYLSPSIRDAHGIPDLPGQDPRKVWGLFRYVDDTFIFFLQQVSSLLW